MNHRFLVTDTHPLLWYMGGQDNKLSKKVLSAFKSAEDGTGVYIWVPMAVIWEISLLMKKTKRITALAPLEELVRENFYSKNITVADQITEDILEAHNLNFIKDPFDALIIATAQRLELPLITADIDITRAKACPVFWD